MATWSSKRWNLKRRSLQVGPPPAIQPFLTGGKLNRNEMPGKLKLFAERAWRWTACPKPTRFRSIKIWAEEIAAGSSDLEASAKLNPVTILTDPRFLYLRRSNNYDLTSRLSYFLWDGPPDATVDCKLAGEQGRLLMTLRSNSRWIDYLQTNMRADLLKVLSAQWIDFTRLDQIAVDPNYYPSFKARGMRIREYMKQECVEFFARVLHKDT